MYRFFIFIFLSVFIGITSYSQTTLVGQVKDKTDDSLLEYASVALFSQTDSSLMTGGITDNAGKFKLTEISSGKFFLRIQFMGYHTHEVGEIVITKGQTHNLGQIYLNADDQLLNEVIVSDQKVANYHKIDRQVYGADQFQSATGGTATDVLKNVPSVAVNAAGELTVRGSSGFTVLLNGKPIQSSPDMILNQLPANAVENIEVVTAPSAKYDPEGKAGIINIITKKGATDGMYLLVNFQGGFPSIEDYDNAQYAQRYGADFTMNFKKDKWDIAIGANYLRNDIAGRREGDVFTILQDTLSRFPSDGERSFDNLNYTARTTIGFYPNKKNNFSLGFYAGKKNTDRTANILYNNYKVYQPENDTLSRTTYYNKNLRIRRGDFVLASLDYNHSWEDQSKISASFLYEYTMLGGPTTNLNLSWPSLQDTIQDQYNSNNNPLNGIRFQLDYSKPWQAGTLDVGYQFRNLDHTGEFFYEQRIIGTDIFQTIPTFSSRVNLTRTIHSFYGMFTGRWNKLSYSAGARMEIMNRDLRLTNDLVDTTYFYDFVKVYPSANLLYQITDQLQLKAAYSKRVERTTTFKMNPFPEREHSETFEQGDPRLLPEFIDLAEVGIIKDFEEHAVFATVYFQHVKNLVNRVNTVYNDTILNRIYSNVGTGQSVGLEVGTDLKLAKWWRLNVGGNLYRYQIDGAFARLPVHTKNWIYSINANTTFTPAPSWTIQWTLNYISEQNTAQGFDSRFLSPNLTIRKTWLDGKLAATLQWLNMDMGLLPTNEQRITTWGSNAALQQQFYTTTNYKYEVDVIMLNLNFSLNQQPGKSKLIKSEFGEKEF